MTGILRFFTGVVLVVLGMNVSKGAAPLPALGAERTATSVSGLSSGAFMAVQYQVAFSAQTRGAGVIAGGPYYCAMGTGLALVPVCMGHVPAVQPSAALLYYLAHRDAAAGRIDALANLKKARIYVFSGTRDTVVRPSAVASTVDFFRLAGVPAAALRFDHEVPAGHAFIAPAYGNDCSANAVPWISHCMVEGRRYDQAGILLRHIYGDLVAPATVLRASVQAFDQSAYATRESGLARTGYVYVPVICRYRSGCRVHVVFHGCLQSAGLMGDGFYAYTGYLRWADTNRIIVLFPQIARDTKPNGCWDWFGYTGPDYANRNGPQMQAVHAMIERLQVMPY